MKNPSIGQIWRITNLLLTIKCQARDLEFKELPREPVKFMKEKQMSEELRKSRWEAQRIKLLKVRSLIKSLITWSREREKDGKMKV